LHKVIVNKQKLHEWKKIAKVGGRGYVFSGNHLKDLIEQVEFLLEVTERFVMFDKWVRSDFDRDDAYVEQYFRLLKGVRESLKRITIVTVKQ